MADPELHRAADKDDPEDLLEGLAMAGLAGVLRQLGDLAESVFLSPLSTPCDYLYSFLVAELLFPTSDLCFSENWGPYLNSCDRFAA